MEVWSLTGTDAKGLIYEAQNCHHFSLLHSSYNIPIDRIGKQRTWFLQELQQRHMQDLHKFRRCAKGLHENAAIH